MLSSSIPLGELCLSPIGLSLVTKRSASSSTQHDGAWFSQCCRNYAPQLALWVIFTLVVKRSQVSPSEMARGVMSVCLLLLCWQAVSYFTGKNQHDAWIRAKSRNFGCLIAIDRFQEETSSKRAASNEQPLLSALFNRHISAAMKRHQFSHYVDVCESLSLRHIM